MRLPKFPQQRTGNPFGTAPLWRRWSVLRGGINDFWSYTFTYWFEGVSTEGLRDRVVRDFI